ncbi:hypothetical protein HAX54_053279 [Datura stramonium]|uniref:Uncharacterized protein n=1 Tax=Datura stramonium TaxID=4076 RepID=A0ABS8T0V5_DATST|nr:hypothetical protein [Datura stramonium]
MQAEAEICNDLQVTILANTLNEPQTKEESEFLQEDNFEEVEIILLQRMAAEDPLETVYLPLRGRGKNL